MAIQIGGTTVIDNGRSLQNITGGAILGIQSAGSPQGIGATNLNFIGAGNTFYYNAGTKTLDISIQGGGGGVSTTGITTSAIFSNFSTIYEPQDLTATNYNYFVAGPVAIAATVTVGVGNTFVVI